MSSPCVFNYVPCLDNSSLTMNMVFEPRLSYELQYKVINNIGVLSKFIG